MIDDNTGVGALREIAVDEFGLPSNVLGVTDERFFQLLGRLVPVSASLEHHARDVYQTLKRAPQSESVALGGLRLVGCIEDALACCPESDSRQTLADFVRDAKPLIAHRNLYVHSMMPAQQPGVVYAWRPNPYPKDDEDHTFGEIITIDDMQTDLVAMLALIDMHRRAAVNGSADKLRPYVKPWTPR